MNNGLVAKGLVTQTDITIEELIDSIEIAQWQYGISRFKITEVFSKRGKYSYIIRGLKVEVEDGVVYCLDPDLFLINNGCVLNSFLEDGVTIKKILDNEREIMGLYFDSGYILIEWDLY